MDIQTIAQKLFTGARASHDWDHTIRVLRLCEHIGSEERADMDVLRIAAVLHDIGRPHQDACLGSLCHAVHGAMLAEPIVATLVFSPEQKDNILHCIRTHRFRGMHVPETLEAKVLFDADKLDLQALLVNDILPTFSAASMVAKGVLLDDDALRHSGPMALVELQNGDAAPSYVVGTENFYAITRYNWSSYYAMAVIELGQEVAKAMKP